MPCDQWSHGDGLMGTPARGYTRTHPPFEIGNTVAMKHGAVSERRWRPIADRLADDLVNVAPWCARPVYAVTVMAWTRVEAQLHLVSTWLDKHGPLDGEGMPRPATDLAARLESRAQSLRAELGLSPLALAKLLAAFTTASAGGGGDDSALDKLKAEGRRFVEAREAAQVQESDEDSKVDP